ncbi:MAG: hypothetical protein WBO45_05205, partial [Planctomycetota bacterium]
GLARQANGPVGSAFVSVQHALTATQVTLTWQFGCSAFTSGTSTSDTSIRYELHAAQPFLGQLAIGWSPTAAGTGTCAVAIDLGDDGSVEAAGAATIPVVFGPGPLVVRVVGAANAAAGIAYGPFGSSWSWSGSASAWLSLQLTATHATAMVEGAGCGAPMPGLVATPDLAQGVLLRGDCPIGVDAGVLVVGFAASILPLPLPPFCTLHVAPVLTDWRLPDAQRQVAWSLPVPLAVRPAVLRAQLLGLDADPFALTASPSLRIDFP